MFKSWLKTNNNFDFIKELELATTQEETLEILERVYFSIVKFTENEEDDLK